MTTQPTYDMLDMVSSETIKNGSLAKHTLAQRALNNQHAMMSGFGGGAFTVSGDLSASSSIQLQIRIPLNVLYARVCVLAAGSGIVRVQTTNSAGSAVDDEGTRVLIGSEVDSQDYAAAQIFWASIPWQVNASGDKLDAGKNMVLKVATSKATSYQWIDAVITTSSGVSLFGLALHWIHEPAE